MFGIKPYSNSHKLNIPTMTSKVYVFLKTYKNVNSSKLITTRMIKMLNWGNMKIHGSWKVGADVSLIKISILFTAIVYMNENNIIGGQ